jgi:C4-dicarboxylate transporter DctM subunit
VSPVTIIFIVFVGLLVIRVPVAFSLICATVVGIWLSPLPMSLLIVPTTMWQGLNSFVLLAIPFFILAGNLALAAGVTERLARVATAFVGHIRGGLAHVGVIVNMIMAGMSGSDLADAAATGSVLIPGMRRAGYPAAYAASLIAGAATIGPLIPPSVAFVIFAAATNTSVGRLFLGGATPGFLLGLLLMVQAYFVARRRNYPREARRSGAERIRATLVSTPALAIPVIVLGSILGGFATPTEAAVVAVVAVLILGAVFYRELTWGAVVAQTAGAVRMAGSVLFIIASAAAFGRILTVYGVATSLADWITAMTNSPLVFLLGVNIIYLLLGCFVDTIPILLVFVPLLMPTVTALGIDPIHFGVITVFNLLIGLITPPYGLTMYLVCRMANISFLEFWKYCWPIFLMMVFALALITVFPQLVLWLPNAVFGRA